MDAKPSAPGYPQAPPGYNEATGGAPIQPQIVYPNQQMPMPQQQNGQPVYIVQQPQEIVIIQTATKMAPSFDPYSEFCPHCQTNVITRVERTMGFCSWTMLFLGLFVFFPLLCCFCLDGFKDSRHACPQCGTVLSYKRR